MTDITDTNNQEQSSGNVVPIEKARRKTTGTPRDKLTESQLCRILSDAVRLMPTRLPEFPKRFLVLEPKPGISIPLLVHDDESVTITTRSDIANEIARYCDGPLSNKPEFTIKPKLAREAADYFLSVQQPTDPEEIKTTRWMDEPGLTYRRLPWKKETGDTPTWNKLLTRMSNNQAFIDWIGSLFFAEAHRHNYIWIYGEGSDGKGAINRFLKEVFGTAYRSKTPPTTDRSGSVDKFWAYNLISARLAVFPDCENTTFTTSGFFKSLTGGDPVEVEAKGSMGFTADLKTRYAIFANCKPAIMSAKSDIRRIIYCEMEPTEQDWKGVEKAMWEEGGYFLSQCIDNYLSKYPEHGPLQTDNSALFGVIAENEQHLENFFDEYFELRDRSCYATAKEMSTAAALVWPRQRKPYSQFLAWLKRVHGIQVHVERTGSDMERRYYGIGRKRVAHAQNSSRFEPPTP